MFFSKKSNLEHQLMNEIITFAQVDSFPLEDAKVISDIISAYNRGNGFIDFALLTNRAVLEKYPNLYTNWDNIMLKYKKLGLFPNWNILVFDDEINQVDDSLSANYDDFEKPDERVADLPEYQICKTCGAQMAPSMKYCGNCGAKLEGDQRHTSVPRQSVKAITKEDGRNHSERAITYPDQLELQDDQTQVGNNLDSSAKSNQLGMKWYYFLIFFGLFAAALTNFFSAAQYFTGSIYVSNGFLSNMDEIPILYSYYPALRVIDQVYGIFLFVLACACIYIRMELAEYKVKAGTKYTKLLLASMISLVCYNLFLHIILIDVGGVDFSNIVTTVFVRLIIYSANRKYFNKRQHLFVN